MPQPQPQHATFGFLRTGRKSGHHCPYPSCRKPRGTTRCIEAKHCGYCPCCAGCVSFLKGCDMHYYKKDGLLRYPPVRNKAAVAKKDRSVQKENKHVQAAHGEVKDNDRKKSDNSARNHCHNERKQQDR